MPSKTSCFSFFFPVAFRRKHSVVPLFCFLILFILLTHIGKTERANTVTVNNEKPFVQEIRHVHECHCLVTVAPFNNLKKLDEDNKSIIQSDSRKRVPTTTLKYLLQEKYKVSIQNDVNASIERIHGSSKNLGSTIVSPKVKYEERNIKVQERESDERSSYHRAKDPDSILNRITLKPNLTRMINASQTVSTVNSSYILENPSLCSSVHSLHIVIIVHTSPEHQDRRFSIRHTWANDAFYHHLGSVRTVFLLGKPKDQSMQKQLQDEFKRYGDLLQGNFIDDYHNLTLKGVMAYKWLTERCRNANFVLKVDDDISVDMFKMFTIYYPKYQSENMTIIYNHILAKTMHILRQNVSKWYVSYDHFRGQKSYPTDYCSGFMVLFTNDLIPALYKSSKLTPFFWVDDVYLYGLVPGNVPGMKYIGLKGGWHQMSAQKAIMCYKNESEACPFLVSGAKTKEDVTELWSYMVKRYALSHEANDLKRK